MKKIIFFIICFLLCGCSNMETISQEDVKNKENISNTNVENTIQEINAKSLDTKQIMTNLSVYNYICNENNEQMVDLYFEKNKDGNINTNIYYNIETDTKDPIEGIFFVNVDEKIVPVSIEQNMYEKIHYISLPQGESITNLDIALDGVDPDYNHMITFNFVYVNDGSTNIETVSKFIGTEKNKTYMDYMGKISYAEGTKDNSIKDEIKLYESMDETFMSSNLYCNKYQGIFETGDIFPTTADEEILLNADQKKRELTEEELNNFSLSGYKDSLLYFDVMYKPINEASAKCGVMFVWCNNNWANFDGEQGLYYDLEDDEMLQHQGSIKLPNESGTYDLWVLNLDLNDPTGSKFYPSVVRHTVTVE